MNEATFNRRLIRLPLDYVGRPEIASIRVTIPSTLRPTSGGSEFEIGLQIVDRWGFHLPGASAHLALTLEGGAGYVPATVAVSAEQDSHLTVKGQVSERGRVYRVRARDRESGIEALSNPAWLPDAGSSTDYQLYWGDLHAHRIENPKTKLSDPLLWSYGPATVDEFYRFARDVAHLDFAALTDHDYALTTDEWRQIQEGVQFYYQPERFVTFLAYEWAWNSDADADHGHRNILFLQDDMPLISSNWQGSHTPPHLFNILHKLSRTGTDILSIPHHPARLSSRIWYDWDTLDPRFERLIEIYSGWGSSEHEGEPYAITSGAAPDQWDHPDLIYPPHEATGHFVQDGLRLGHRLGIVGGSESHDGRAGSTVVHGPRLAKELSFHHRPGLTGLWARRKTRSALWGGLWHRRTVASTGERILVYQEIDRLPLGQPVRASTSPKTLRVRVHGTAPIAKVVVVKNNRDWHVVERPGWECTFEVHDLPLPSGPADWYYVRVTQEDGNMAWSSPIWIEDANATLPKEPAR
jgi:hypothetical protein